MNSARAAKYVVDTSTSANIIMRISSPLPQQTLNPSSIMKTKYLLLLALLPTLAFGQFKLQEFNEDTDTVVTTTADSGQQWELSGTTEDLTQFSGTSNPFNWRNWQNYSSVDVSGGILEGQIDGTSPRLLTDTNAYSLSTETFRYMELTVSRDNQSGEGTVFYREDGNSVATSGQNANFGMTNSVGSDQVSFIFDMNDVAEWGDGDSGNLTGLGLALHDGGGTSVVNASDFVSSVRLSDSINQVPEPATWALMSGIAALCAAGLRRSNRR